MIILSKEKRSRIDERKAFVKSFNEMRLLENEYIGMITQLRLELMEAAKNNSKYNLLSGQSINSLGPIEVKSTGFFTIVVGFDDGTKTNTFHEIIRINIDPAKKGRELSASASIEKSMGVDKLIAFTHECVVVVKNYRFFE